jgi:molybdate transport repressor ModE-like protein
MLGGMIEVRHLRVLRAVARAGSYSAAARELGLTQPAISQQMKALEKSVGTPLVARVGRETRLTEAGEVLTRHANGVLAGLAAAEEELAAIAGLSAGRVRLVSFPTACSALVPAAVARLRAAEPGVRVSLVEAEPPEAVAMLRAGECEVALAFRYPDGAPADAAAGGCADWTDLDVRPLLEDRLVGVLPAGHRLAGRGEEQPVGLDELAGEQWIAGCPQCRGQLVEMCAAAGFAPDIDFATDDYPAVVSLVATGLGVAVLPEMAMESVRRSGVEVVPVVPSVRREVAALTLPGLAQVPAVALMMDQFAAAVAE